MGEANFAGQSGMRKKKGTFQTQTIRMFPKIGVPPKHPKMVIFSRNTNSYWVPPFRKPP